jgi:hypothetical protein
MADRRYRLSTLFVMTLVVGLVLALWLQHRRHQQFRDTINALGDAPWVKITYPRDEPGSCDVGVGTLSVSGDVFFPGKKWGTPRVTAELVSGSSTIVTTTCKIVDIGAKQVRADGELRLPQPTLAPGKYFIRLSLADSSMMSQEVVSQGGIVEFVDVLAEQ